MDPDYQRRLIEADFAVLTQRIEEKGRDIRPEWVDGTLFVTMYGRGGAEEQYVAKIEPAFYPVGPWRVGFIDPAAKGMGRTQVPDRDPRFWPFSAVAGLHGGFHVSWPGPYRVFVCLPFTTEFFYYHAEHPWQPEVFKLDRMVIELDEALKQADHFSKWYPLLTRGGQ
jgi:hypothetical protein